MSRNPRSVMYFRRKTELPRMFLKLFQWGGTSVCGLDGRLGKFVNGSACEVGSGKLAAAQRRVDTGREL